MVTGTFTARQRHGSQWWEAGDRATIDDDSAALLKSIGKFSPDKEGGEVANVPRQSAPLPPIPRTKKKALDFSPTTEGID